MADEYDEYAEYDPDLILTPEFQLLQNLVKDPNASPEEAVQQVVELTKAEALSGKWPKNTIGGDFAWNISHLALDIATNTKPENQLNLLNFMRKLQTVAVMDPRTGEQLIYDHEKLWTDLPCVGYYSSDLQDFWHYTQHTPEEIEKWENRSTFFARATATSKPFDDEPDSFDPLDFSLLAYFELNGAFESEDVYETAVRTVCIWYIHAAEKLWYNCRMERDHTNENTADRKFDMNKWEFWKRELIAASGVYKEGGTRMLIKEAMECINCVDSSN
ncbi:hypothetical protein SI65_00239 [Aspergillus cristatus]|uniref:Uncharacterized protein n=1 Tax=Aspergillus cristatus TaxID=573508 RepID=A0A1E3BNW3_ASPCR|nr:hypothetical protein SI65_00239 [Aspergillus cristatus]